MHAVGHLHRDAAGGSGQLSSRVLRNGGGKAFKGNSLKGASRM